MVVMNGNIENKIVCEIPISVLSDTRLEKAFKFYFDNEELNVSSTTTEEVTEITSSVFTCPEVTCPELVTCPPIVTCPAEKTCPPQITCAPEKTCPPIQTCPEVSTVETVTCPEPVTCPEITTTQESTTQNSVNDVYSEFADL